MTTRRQVLIADDDRDIRDSLRFLLETEEDCVVTEVADGAEALAVIQNAREPLMAFLDQVMPRLTGIGVMRAVAEDAQILARTRFVLFSARHNEFPPDDAALLQRLGVIRVHKPFDIEEVIAALRE